MRLFEQFGAVEFVLKVANVALSVGESEDRNMVRLLDFFSAFHFPPLTLTQGVSS